MVPPIATASTALAIRRGRSFSQERAGREPAGRERERFFIGWWSRARDSDSSLSGVLS
jgi:hypothetical protein